MVLDLLSAMRTFVFFAAATIAGCGGTEARPGSGDAGDAGLVTAVPSCIPGRSVSCACTNGATGAQVCATNGSSYGDCVCTGAGLADASLGGDGSAGVSPFDGSDGSSSDGPVDAGQPPPVAFDASWITIDAGWIDLGNAGIPEGGPTPEGGAWQCALPTEAAGRWIAFDSTFGGYNRDIYMARADGSGLGRLTTDPTTEKEPAFSNSGRWLAFTSDRTGTMQVYLMDLLTYEIRQLTSFSAGADEPSWSPDDAKIAFHSGASVYVMGMDGSDPQVVGTGLDAFNAYQYPVFTRDGTRLLFDRNNEIDTLLLDGGGFRYVIDNTTTTIKAPAVSPDGVNVAFSYVPGSQVIAVAPFAASSDAFSCQTIVSGSRGSARKPAWGTASVVAFEDGQVLSSSWQIVEASIALSTGPGSTPCQLANGQTDSRNPAWAPVGFQPTR